MSAEKLGFFVLELPPTATPAEIERQGRKLLALLELGAPKYARYTCVLGTYPRDETLVRDAMASLREPATRELEAFLVGLLTGSKAPEPVAGDPLETAFRLADFEGL